MKDTNLLIQNGIDVNRGIELLGDIETYNEMLEDFLTETDEKISNLKSYKEQKDMPNYAILAHSLKSDSKYFGFTKLIDLAYQHELQSKANDIDFVNNHFEELQNEVNRVVNLIKTYLGK